MSEPINDKTRILNNTIIVLAAFTAISFVFYTLTKTANNS